MGFSQCSLIIVAGLYCCLELSTQDYVATGKATDPPGLQEVADTNWYFHNTPLEYNFHNFLVTLRAVSGAIKLGMPCIGAAITRKHIITAARCVQPVSRTDSKRMDPSATPFVVKIRTLSNHSHKEGTIVYSSKVCLDPEYEEFPDGTWKGRMLALLTLDVPLSHLKGPVVSLHPTVGPCTPTRTKCWLYGWRKDFSRYEGGRATSVKIVNNCSTVFQSDLVNDSYNLCLMNTNGPRPFTFLYYYSGSLMICNGRLLAVGSSLISSPSPNYIIAARVDTARQWLTKCMDSNDQSHPRFHHCILLSLIFCLLFV